MEISYNNTFQSEHAHSSKVYNNTRVSLSPIPAPVVRAPAEAAPVALESSAYSAIENTILRSHRPVEHYEGEVVSVNGHTGLWINKDEVTKWRGDVPISQYPINEDSNPEILCKRTDQELVYDQEVAIRYLRPPTPPPPGEIIIKQEKNIVTPPAPPLIVRQQPPRPETPAPIIYREAPPAAPVPIGPKIVTISGKRLAPPPRKVVIERMPPIPSKPQGVIVERWLPYTQQKRRVIFQRNQVADPVIPKPRNVIVQWDAPQVQIKKQFKDLGVVRANPAEYVAKYGASLRQSHELPEIVKEVPIPSGVVLAANYVAPSLIELEGDVHALGLIDLDREGLSQYKSYLASRTSATAHATSYDVQKNVPASSFTSTNYDTIRSIPVTNYVDSSSKGLVSSTTYANHEASRSSLAQHTVHSNYY